jgi:hypothetical protein
VTRNSALVPALSVVDGSGSLVPPGRDAHPAGRSRFRAEIPFEDLLEIAAGLAQSATDLVHEWAQGTRRRYAGLIATSTCDAWLIEWASNSRLEFHDHGGSRGVVHVVAGRLVETYTDLHEPHPLRTQVVRTGESFQMSASRAHEVASPGPETTRSVHVYSPPLRGMTFFDPAPPSFPTAMITTR